MRGGERRENMKKQAKPVWQHIQKEVAALRPGSRVINMDLMVAADTGMALCRGSDRWTLYHVASEKTLSRMIAPLEAWIMVLTHEDMRVLASIVDRVLDGECAQSPSMHPMRGNDVLIAQVDEVLSSVCDRLNHYGWWDFNFRGEYRRRTT